MSARSEVLDRVVLDAGGAVTVWRSSWAPQPRLERLGDDLRALTHHYVRLTRTAARSTLTHWRTR